MSTDDERRKRDVAIAHVQTTPAEQDLAQGSTLGMGDAPPPGPTTGELAAGTRLGRFVVRAQLGQGGMGIVFAGEDIELGRPVAIKVVRSDIDQPAYRDRLLREAQAMARLEHPHVVRVYEVGTDRGRLFVAMEYVDGETLTKWLVPARPWRDIVAMFVQVGDGLAAVHRSGLVHRDFKPDNVLVDRGGQARVADFGLARVEDNSMPPLTRTGLVMGTPGYMAPEQQWGSDVDARADQYSFCVALREATKRNPDLPKAVRAAIARGLAYDAAERFPSMAELLAQLRGTVRHAARWAFAGVALVVVVGGAVTAVVASSGGVRTETKTQIVQSPVIVQTPIVVPADDERTPTAMATAPKPVPPAPAAAPPPAPPKPTGLGSYTRPGSGSGSGSGSNAISTAKPAPAPPPSTPAPKAKVVRHEIDPKHRVPVRVVVHDLGYGGLTFIGDPTDDEKLTRDQLAAQGPDDHLQRAALIYALGAAQRREGRCGTAIATWASAFEALSKANEANRTDALVWRFWTRTKFAMAICMLEEGRGLDAWALLDKDVRQTSFGFPDDERAAFHFVAGVAGWETGDPDAIHEIQMGMGFGATKPMKVAAENWAKLVGL